MADGGAPPNLPPLSLKPTARTPKSVALNPQIPKLVALNRGLEWTYTIHGNVYIQPLSSVVFAAKMLNRPRLFFSWVRSNGGCKEILHQFVY
ncbi:hypothetical protein ACS0TY_019677 [Phlomoides rotata]